MKEKLVKQYVEEVKEKLGITKKIRMKFKNNLYKTHAYKQGNTITFSKNALAINDDKSIKCLVAHEVVHFLEPNHSKRFYKILNKIGLNKPATTPAKYSMYCSCCKKSIGKQINILKKYNYVCAICHSTLEPRRINYGY